MRKSLIAGLMAFILAFASPSNALAYDERTVVVDTAYSALGLPYRSGAEGPSRFDCSGYVWWVYSTAGLADRIGGSRMRARGYQRWFREQGLLFTDKKLVEVGDLAFWGKPAVHVGIVTRIGRPPRRPNRINVFVTSATTNFGVKEIRIDYIRTTKPFANFADVDLRVVEPTPEPTPSPEPTPEPTTTIEPTPTPTPYATE